jgi:hypothetical protein
MKRLFNDSENQTEQLLSRRGLCLRWQVCGMTIQRLERAGKLKAVKFNQRLLRYRLSDIIAIETAAATAHGN